MNDSTSHSALRELRADISRPNTVAVLAGIAAVLALTGPFGTLDLLHFAPRFGYWATTVAATYCAGHIASSLVRAVFENRLSRWPMVIVTGLAIGAAVSLVVIALNALFFGLMPSASVLPQFLVSTFGIALVIAAVFDIVERNRQDTLQATAPEMPPLLDRLPLDKRGPLVALSVEDHYVRIRTTKGEEMVLMRLSDAIRETGSTDGLQVHRSHWVARGAVTSAARTGDRAVLTMSLGPDIPVSRANIAKLKEAGLLPR